MIPWCGLYEVICVSMGLNPFKDKALPIQSLLQQAALLNIPDSVMSWEEKTKFTIILSFCPASLLGLLGLVAGAQFTEMRKILCRKEQCPHYCGGTIRAGVSICAMNSPSLFHRDCTESKSLIRSNESSSLDLKALAVRTHCFVFHGFNCSCLECRK